MDEVVGDYSLIDAWGAFRDKFDRRLKPEGITRVSSGEQSFIFIVFDTSGYAAQD